VLLLCTNTMHKVADQVQAAIGIPLLHIADVTAAAVTEAGLTTIGLLGTAFTMEQDFYRDRLTGHGLTVLVPGANHRALVHRIIYDELCLGVVLPESRLAYQQVIRSLADSGAQGVVLGCTEIPLLISQHDSALPIIDSTRTLARAAIRESMLNVAPSGR